MRYPDQIIQFAKKYNLDRDEEILSAIEFCLLDETLMPQVQQIMMAEVNNNNNKGNNDNNNIVNPDPFPPPRAEEIEGGEIKLGHIFQNAYKS